KQSIRRLIELLWWRRFNTVKELCRAEQIFASGTTEEDARALRGPMKSAWDHYVNSNQMLLEMQGLTPDCPFSGDILTKAQDLVRSDSNSDRSWNLAWLCLVRIRDHNLVAKCVVSKATRSELWADDIPTPEEIDQLADEFQVAWEEAVNGMLLNW
ncbi:hypothetical protein B0T17DRAFT_475715, partial [Bombardia bombarda]